MKQFLIRIEHISGALSGTSELCWCGDENGLSAQFKSASENRNAICTLARDNQGQLITRIV